MFASRNKTPQNQPWRDAMGPGYFSALSCERVGSLFAPTATGDPVQRRR